MAILTSPKNAAFDDVSTANGTAILQEATAMSIAVVFADSKDSANLKLRGSFDGDGNILGLTGGTYTLSTGAQFGLSFADQDVSTALDWSNGSIRVDRLWLALFAGDDWITLGHGSDRVDAGAGNDLVRAGGGNDTVAGGPGNDVLDGDAGTDTAVFTNALSGYRLTRGVGSLEVQDLTFADGKDSLQDFERLQFPDFAVNLTVQDAAAGIARADLDRLEELYVAFFNRTPDADGLEYWIGQFKGGMTINEIAESFYTAGVFFSDLTGYLPGMTNADFVNTVYRNVLGREEGADAEGLAYWTGELEAGRASRGKLVSDILDSAHQFKGNPYGEGPGQYGQVADLLDNKIVVADTFAVQWGLNYLTAQESIAQGMAIAAAVTPLGIDAAIALIGIEPGQIDLIA